MVHMHRGAHKAEEELWVPLCPTTHLLRVPGLFQSSLYCAISRWHIFEEGDQQTVINTPQKYYLKSFP